jgi:peptide/nickel transport system ATP-binding protein
LEREGEEGAGAGAGEGGEEGAGEGAGEGGEGGMPMKKVLFKARDLTRVFGTRKNRIVAVDHINFEIYKGEIVSLVGQSGSGKTTTASMILRLLKPTEGTMEFENRDVEEFEGRGKREYWRKVQAIFQDPYSSFNQFFSTKKVLFDSFKLFENPPPKSEKEALIKEALEAVNMSHEEVAEKYPFELSGGQRQRIMIARAHLIKPKLLIADEPTSMIDAVLRSCILELLLNLRKEEGSSIVFITHDLGLAYYVSDRIFIMNKGKIVEKGNAEQVITHPKDQYTKNLIGDIPNLSEEWIS